MTNTMTVLREIPGKDLATDLMALLETRTACFAPPPLRPFQHYELPLRETLFWSIPMDCAPATSCVASSVSDEVKSITPGHAPFPRAWGIAA
ncbi:hypothetical protein [Burkholderia pyrrocinia]|uniref:hypothetical protein n=1 Tax=Burkholderia pyrrocinia TaxID=60550 RepID=UPI0030D4C9B1